MNDDLISRQEAIKDAESWVGMNWYEQHLQRNVVEWLKEFPPAQPKRGKWLPADSLYHGAPFYYCSECGEKMLDTVMGKPRWNFCPNCGADMRGERDG